MTVRLRVTCGEQVREFAFDRPRISIGAGPFNDLVFSQGDLARVQGTLEVDGDGELVFQTRASGQPTAVFRDTECVCMAEGRDEEALELRAGDVVRMGEDPSVDLEIVAVECEAHVEWESEPLPAPGELELSAAEGQFFFGLTQQLAAAPTIERLLRLSALCVGYCSGAAPTCVELAIPVEVDPWRSDDFLLRNVHVSASAGYQNASVEDVEGDYMRTRDPLPPFDPAACEVIGEFRSGGRAVVLGAHETVAHILIPFEYDGELSAVLDFSFRGVDVEAIAARVARAGAVLRPLAAGMLGRRTLERHCDSVLEENRYWRERQRRSYLFKDLVSESDAMRAVYDQINAWVDDDEPVLLVGEAGSGKALMARALHHLGPRKEAMFTSLNCRELSGDKLDYELFGNVANDLSGDVEPRKGIFEMAEGGTVLLEEIEQLSPMVQGKVLRMLREGEVRRIGDAVARRVDVRLVASTHRDLSELVAKGRFRRDLHLALEERVLQLPALRERREDILPLARIFLRSFASRYERPCRRLSPEVRQRLLDHHWEGNVRELQAVIEAAVLECDGEEIEMGDLALSSPSH